MDATAAVQFRGSIDRDGIRSRPTWRSKHQPVAISRKATDLKKRLWFTIGALIVFRLLSFVPLPGIDPTRARALLRQQTQGGVLDFFNTFSGGALQRMSLIALGVMPYITASIVVQLATSLCPHARRDQEGRRERAQEAQPIYALRHRAADRGPGLFHRRRARERSARRRACRRWSSRACCSASPRSSRWSAAPCS